MFVGFDPDLGKLVLNDDTGWGMCGDFDVVPPGVRDKDSVEVVGVDVINQEGNHLVRGHGVSGYVFVDSKSVLISTYFGEYTRSVVIVGTDFIWGDNFARGWGIQLPVSEIDFHILTHAQSVGRQSELNVQLSSSVFQELVSHRIL